MSEAPKPKGLTEEQWAAYTPEQQYWFWQRVLLRQMFGKDLQPSPEQDEILRCNARIILVSGGEQAGKSLTAAMFLVSRAALPMLSGRSKRPLYWLVGADYEQSRREFTYALEAYTSANMVRESDISMPVRGTWQFRALERKITVTTKTTADVRKLGRDAPDGILINEAAQVDYDVYLKCLGRTAPKRGWLFLSGTLESGADWYADALRRWQAPNQEEAQSFILPSWSNLALYPGGRNDPEIKRIEGLLPKDKFLMRFGAVASPPDNLVLPEFQYKVHIPGDVVYDSQLPVQVWVDPGYSGSHYAVEVVQIAGSDHHYDGPHIHVVDEVYVQNAMVGMIIEDCRDRDWWENLELVVIDIAGTQHDAMPSQAEIWGAEGFGVAYQRVGIEDNILRHRTFLQDPGEKKPRIYFHEGCVGAIREYGKWLRTKVTGLLNQAAKPQIINCDAMKAIGYGLIHNFGYVEYEGGPTKVVLPWSF